MDAQGAPPRSAGWGRRPTRAAVRAAFKASPAFTGLPCNVIDEIAALARWQECAKGHVLFREGDPVDAIFLLGRGRAKITTVSADGREQLLHLLEPGDVFPRVGLFRTGSFPGTASVDEGASVAVIRKVTVMDLAQRESEVALALLGMMDEVIRSLHRRLRSMALADVKSRVQQVLLEGTGGKLTHQEIASLVGAARETVSRAIADLRREGIMLPQRRAKK